jgi:hypothetical protein
MDPLEGEDKPRVAHPGDWVYCSGWAVIPGEDRLPKFVLFSVNGEERFVYAARLGSVGRPDIAARFRNPSLVKAGWGDLIPAKLLPAGISRLTAWAYDDQREEFVRLRGGQLILKF